jgi:hypothetical protein
MTTDPRGSETTPTGSIAPDCTTEAWKALGLVNDWLRHAEGKAGATLAALGVTGGLLYNLVKSQENISVFLAIVSTLCGLAVITGGVFALLALKPRLRSQEEATSRLYFDHIARRHPGVNPAPYQQELVVLVQSSSNLIAEIGQQIWSNSKVASVKYKWTAYALVSLAIALCSIALVAAALGVKSLGGL